MASKIPPDVLARKKRFKKVEEQQRNATAQFREAKVVLMQSPEVSSQSSVKAELLRLRNKFEFCESSVRGYMRDESRFQRYGALEVKVEQVDGLLSTCEADVGELVSDAAAFHASVVEMVEGFSRRIKSLHTKMKRFRAGFLNVAKRRVTAAKATLRERPPQLGAMPEIQDALQRCEMCVVSMTTLLEQSKVDLLSEEAFNFQMRGLIQSLDEEQSKLDVAELDLTIAVNRGMEVLGKLTDDALATAPASPSSSFSTAARAIALKVEEKNIHETLCPWVERADGQGNTYYENTVSGLTQWERPPDFGERVKAPEIMSTRGSATSFANANRLVDIGSNGGSGQTSATSTSVLRAGKELRENDELAKVLIEAQRAAHMGAGAMTKTIDVDHLVLGDNTIVKVNEVQKHRAYHFLATGEVIGPRELKIKALERDRAQRQRELEERLETVEHLGIGELKGELEDRRCRAAGQRHMLEKRLREAMKREWENVENALRKAEDRDIAENGDLVSSGRGDAHGGSSVPVFFEDAYDKFARENPQLQRTSNNARRDSFYRAAKARMRKIQSTGDIHSSGGMAAASSAVGRMHTRSTSSSSLQSVSANSAALDAGASGAAPPQSKGCVVQ